MKTILSLNQKLPFAQNPRFVELENDRILCNNIIFEREFNPHNVRLFVIGNEYGALGAVWASHDQEAIDTLVDEKLGDGILLDPKEMTEEELSGCATAGNTSEPIDSDHLWIEVVEFDKIRDFEVLMKFAEARGANVKNLDEL